MMRRPDARGLRRRLVNLRFPATGVAVREALVTIDATLAAAGAVEDLRIRTQIALAEACNNIVEHAYPPDTNPSAMIRLDISGDAGGLQITLRDWGRAMPDGTLPGKTLPVIDPEHPDTWPEGGFGWPLLRTMARSLSLSRRKGQNILRFRLVLSGQAGQIDENAA